MEIFTIYNVLCIILAAITIIVIWLQNKYTYWQRRGIYNPPPSLLFGNSGKMFLQKHSFSDFLLEMYNAIKKKRLHGGFYLLFMPVYMPTDPKLIKHILQNDFNHFVDRGMYINEKSDPLSGHLFSLEGKAWRNLRTKISPTFTSGKLKMMFETLVKCSDQLTIEMDKTVGKESVNIKDLMVRFTIDVIGSCGFGIDCNSLKNPNTEFIRYCQLFFYESLWGNIKQFLTFTAPDFFRKFGVLVINPKLSEFFMRVVKNTVEYREKNNIHRKDFMHLLLQLKNRGKLVDDGQITDNKESKEDNDVLLSFNQLAAHAFVFFLAGFETSSTTLAFCLFELATNSDVQEKLRQEVKAVLERYENKITYDGVMEMYYMEKVINETLRKYPPIPVLNRICIKEYKVPGTDVIIEKGTKVFVSVVGLHRDDEYYPNPNKFDPERFSEENKQSRHPFTFLPFGEGPRICIGMKLGMLETKVALTVLMQNYQFTLNEKTQVPLKMNPRNFIMSTKDGIWLDYIKIK